MIGILQNSTVDRSVGVSYYLPVKDASVPVKAGSIVTVRTNDPLAIREHSLLVVKLFVFLEASTLNLFRIFKTEGIVVDWRIQTPSVRGHIRAWLHQPYG